MSAKTYDAIGLGVGGMGSAACWHLARRGVRVLGLERFDIPHAMGYGLLQGPLEARHLVTSTAGLRGLSSPIINSLG